MKKYHVFKMSFLSIAALVTFSSCNDPVTVNTPDGKVPQQFSAMASLLSGVYGDAQLTLSLEDDKPIVTATPDLLGDGCHSTIGPLEKIQLKKEDVDKTDLRLFKSPLTAIFAFGSNGCQGVQGNQLTLQFSENDDGEINLYASVFKDVEDAGKQYCWTEQMPNDTSPTLKCEELYDNIYLAWNLKRRQGP